jgi:hypothetical protein
MPPGPTRQTCPVLLPAKWIDVRFNLPIRLCISSPAFQSEDAECILADSRDYKMATAVYRCCQGHVNASKIRAQEVFHEIQL